MRCQDLLFVCLGCGFWFICCCLFKFYSSFCLFAFWFWWVFLFGLVIHIFTCWWIVLSLSIDILVYERTLEIPCLLTESGRKLLNRNIGKLSFPVHFAGVLWLPLCDQNRVLLKKSVNEKNVYIISFQIRHFKSTEISRQNFPNTIFWVI